MAEKEPEKINTIDNHDNFKYLKMNLAQNVKNLYYEIEIEEKR